MIAADLKSRGVGLKILTGEGAAVDTTHAQGRMIFGILAVMAEFEREMISERTVAGMVAARNRGVRVGRLLKLQIPTKSPADSEMMSPGWRAPC